MLRRKGHPEDRRNHGPSLVRPLARYAFAALASGFAFTAIGQDPVALATGAGHWILASALHTIETR